MTDTTSVPIADMTGSSSKADLFTPAIREQIDRWVAKYPGDWKQSAVIAALFIVQKANGGWLSEASMNDVAAYLDMPPIAVYEVATFYSMFELKPVGRHKICLCTNVSCMINDVDRIVEHLEKKLDVKMGQTTADGRFTLKEVECLGACGGAPMMQIGEKYYENLTPEIVDSILDRLE
jgi:NADH-quinone oxidoreductase subunit E